MHAEGGEEQRIDDMQVAYRPDGMQLARKLGRGRRHVYQETTGGSYLDKSPGTHVDFLHELGGGQPGDDGEIVSSRLMWGGPSLEGCGEISQTRRLRIVGQHVPTLFTQRDAHGGRGAERADHDDLGFQWVHEDAPPCGKRRDKTPLILELEENPLGRVRELPGKDGIAMIHDTERGTHMHTDDR